MDEPGRCQDETLRSIPDAKGEALPPGGATRPTGYPGYVLSFSSFLESSTNFFRSSNLDLFPLGDRWREFFLSPLRPRGLYTPLSVFIRGSSFLPAPIEEIPSFFFFPFLRKGWRRWWCLDSWGQCALERVSMIFFSFFFPDGLLRLSRKVPSSIKGNHRFRRPR